MKISELLQTGSLSEADPRPALNFDADDLQILSQMKDLSKAKQFALELITRPSQKPLKPQKVAWFKAALAGKNSVNAISKMLYDMMLSGEGNGVIGSTHSTDPSRYRQKFGEAEGMISRAYDLYPVSAMTPDKKIIRIRSRHDLLPLPAGSIILDVISHVDDDVSKETYKLLKKTVDTADLMDSAYEDMGELDVAAYPKSGEVELAFAQQASKLL